MIALEKRIWTGVTQLRDARNRLFGGGKRRESDDAKKKLIRSWKKFMRGHGEGETLGIMDNIKKDTNAITKKTDKRTVTKMVGIKSVRIKTCGTLKEAKLVSKGRKGSVE